jgi:hypothetical protein
VPYEETLTNLTLDADSSIGFYTGFPGMPGSQDPNWGRQYRFVKIVGAHQAGLATAATAAEKLVGVLQNKPQTVGDAATVAISGVSMMQSGGVIAAGDYIGSDGTGRAVKVTTGLAYGLAYGSAAAADQLVAVQLFMAGRTVA